MHQKDGQHQDSLMNQFLHDVNQAVH